MIILASASPRRKDLLKKIGLKFKVDPSEFSENLREDLSPEELVKCNSTGKAKLAASKHPGAIIIAADTLGVIDDRIIGKPHSPEEAVNILQNLSGKTHRVITGLTVIDTVSKKILSRTVETYVLIKNLTPQEIQNYVRSGEPLDKAGAYAIQGLGAMIVEKITGDFYNVVGLPLSVLVDCLRELGVSLL